MAGLEKIVTDELVFEIADRLAAEGRKVSNRVIWSEVGGGSMTTIAAALRRWRERQELKAEQPIERAPLPELIAEAMRDAVDRLWKAAQDETQKEIDRLTQTMNERVAEATAERDGALAELQSAVEELQAMQTRYADIEAERDAAAGELVELRKQIAATTERANTAEARSVEIERRANDLSAELSRVHDETKVERDRHAGELANARTEIDQVRAELVEIKQATAAEIERLRAELVTSKVNVEAAAQEANRALERMAKAEADRDQVRHDAGQAREEAAKLRGQVEAMQTQQAELMRALSARQASHGDEQEPSKGVRSKAPKKGE